MVKMAAVVLKGVQYMFVINTDDDLTDGELLICKEKNGEYSIGTVKGSSFYTDNVDTYLNNFGAKIADSEIVAIDKCTLWEREAE